MNKDNIPLLSDEFLEEVTKEINDIYGFDNNPNEETEKEFLAEENET
ncbi:bacitracin ABC transporter ATP-binding protein [Metabacillus idriensis]|nr:bacitracin ABC transporter ATP-binding protein [Metabacillus idriensis]MDR0136578.1 bacitracin ABC transporter ATP-binding protein [Metabacillus idriensis]